MSRLLNILYCMGVVTFISIIGILLGFKAPSTDVFLLISFMAAWVNDKK